VAKWCLYFVMITSSFFLAQKSHYSNVLELKCILNLIKLRHLIFCTVTIGSSEIFSNISLVHYIIISVNVGLSYPHE